VGIGFIRKALLVATAGLSGRVFKDSSKKEPTAKADVKRVRSRKQTKTTRPKPQAARRPKPQAARTSTIAPIVGAGNGTTNELERLADLHGRGSLTDEEFAAAKAKILGTSLTPDTSDGGPATFQAIEASVGAARHLADLAGHDRGASVTTVGND
jgi:Short C-terminal domain